MAGGARRPKDGSAPRRLPWKIRLLCVILFAICQLRRRHYLEESTALALALKVPLVDRRVMAALQRVYTLAHAGCTAAVFEHRDLGMVHLRCLDWEDMRAEMADGTRILDFQRNGRTVFRAVGVVGTVGVLSGVRPGNYSVTINWAQSKSAITPWVRHDPTLLLRHVLETCGTYDEAVAKLSAVEVGAPVFYTVCGAAPGQGCVIEIAHFGWLRQRCRIRRLGLETPWLVQTNHYDECGDLVDENIPPGPRKRATWAEESLEVSSRERRRAMGEEVAKLVDLRAESAMDFMVALRTPPVVNDHTVQQMLFRPKVDELHAWARRPPTAADGPAPPTPSAA